MPALQVSLEAEDVSFDPVGDMIVPSDSFRDTIRRVDASTGLVSAVAGQPNLCCQCTGDGGPAVDAYFYNVSTVVADAGGRLFVSEFPDGAPSSCRGRRIDIDTGMITAIPCILGESYCDGWGVMGPLDFSSAPDGSLVFSDLQCKRIRRLGLATGHITDAAGSTTTVGYGGDGGPA